MPTSTFQGMNELDGKHKNNSNTTITTLDLNPAPIEAQFSEARTATIRTRAAEIVHAANFSQGRLLFISHSSWERFTEST
jgi:hypothetical protein